MGNTKGTPTSDGSIKTFIETEIAENEVVIFSKSYCPYCTKTKQTFSGPVGAGHSVKVLELDRMSNGDEIQATLLQITGQRTVPNVFVNGQHLGGNDDTQKAAASGRLQEMLAK
ncbi:glutaredoxin [Fragilaria crotonensis]|nr:glutaredoxin [Fragilaria crotonensis]